ncbi:MAG TPA: DUF3108 domain-containing protein [Kofleriaceae bacterium]|jgi:hypothetical protein
MRVLPLGLLLSLPLLACGPAVGFAPKPLPDLVATTSTLGPLAAKDLVLNTGESLAWDVSVQGLSIGRAEMAIGEQEVRTRFETNMLASAVAKAKYDLVTVIDRTAQRPIGANENIEVGGERTSTNASFDGKTYSIGDPPEPHAVPDGNVHTLHSALALIRGWAEPQAQGGTLYVLVAGKIFQLTMSRPIFEELHSSPAIKVIGKITPLEGSAPTASIAMWLTNTPAKTPLRIEIVANDKQITAELIDE